MPRSRLVFLPFPGARFMAAFCLLSWACLVPILPASAAVKVQFELKEGATVSDTVTVAAKVTGADDIGIDKVEFLVDDQLKSTDTSTPYSFDWDTLAETEGKHTLTATAFDAQGRSQRAKINVVIDNELSKGADYLAGLALTAIKENKPDTAAKYSRRALKVDPNNRLAARSLAGVARAKGEYKQALAMLENVELPDNDIEVREELVALYIASAGNAETTEEFLKSAAKAVEVYSKLTAARISRAGATDARSKGDAFFAARNWTGAVGQYQKSGEGENPPMENVNRLILAYINAGRTKEALATIGTLDRQKRSDDGTRALHGFILLRDHQFARAHEIVQEGIENDSLPSLIVASYADLGLKQTKRAQAEAEKAFAIAPKLPEVLLLRAFTLNDAIDSDHAVMKALEYDPAQAEAYAVRGYQTMLTRASKRFSVADQLFDFALKRDPTCTYAQLGLALSLMGQNRTNEAEPLIVQALAGDPNGPDIHVARAVCYGLADKTVNINSELALAKKLDPEHWDDTYLPKINEMIGRTYLYRHPAVLTPLSLYPPKAIGE